MHQISIYHYNRLALIDHIRFEQPFSLKIYAFKNPERVCDILYYLFEKNYYLNCIEIYLNKNKLEIVPKILAKYTALEVLDLSDNELTAQDLPDFLFNFQNLKHFNLSANRIKAFKKNHIIWNFPELKHLELSSVGLKILPDLNACKKLEILNLCSNNLAYLAPEKLSQLPHLKELRLSGQSAHLRDIYFLLHQLPAIRKLDLAAITYLENRKHRNPLNPHMQQNYFYFLPSFFCEINFPQPITLNLSYHGLNFFPEFTAIFDALVFSCMKKLFAIPLDGRIIAKQVISDYIRCRLELTYPEEFLHELRGTDSEKSTRTHALLQYIDTFKKSEIDPFVDYYKLNRVFSQASRTHSGTPVLYCYGMQFRRQIYSFLLPKDCLKQNQKNFQALESIEKLDFSNRQMTFSR